MIHSSYYKPRVFPVFGEGDSAEIDRLQELNASNTLNRTRLMEIGRPGTMDWKKQTPTVNLTMRQLEYGSIEFWQKLANKGESVNQVSWTDFTTAAVDIAGYKTDDNGTFLGTIYYPSFRLSGLGLNIGDPNAMMERSFTLVGEDEIILQNNNKYLIGKEVTMTAGANQTITVSDPVPVADPDNSGQFIFKVVRIRAGVGTELVPGTEWSCNGSAITINGTSANTDVIKYWYSGTSYITGATIFSNNDSDLHGVSANQCSIYLQSSSYVYRLQSVAVDTTFDRQDVKEIGNDAVVARGVRQVTNRITLGRILEAWTIEEILRGVAGQSFGKIDPKEFTSGLNLIIKIYSDTNKSTFKMGYKFLELAPTSIDDSAPLNDYIQRNTVLEGETAFVTTNNAIL